MKKANVYQLMFFKLLAVIFSGALLIQLSSQAGAAQLEGKGPMIRVAAIQMKAELGDVDGNLAKAERLVREAFGKGAKWVILPEFFTSAMAVHHRCVTRMFDGLRSRWMMHGLAFLSRGAYQRNGGKSSEANVRR